MKPDKIPKLDADILELLDVERNAPPASGLARARVLDQLQKSIEALPDLELGDLDVADGSSLSSSAGGDSLLEIANSGTVELAGSSTLAALGGIGKAKVAAMIAAGFVAGVGTTVSVQKFSASGEHNTAALVPSVFESRDASPADAGTVIEETAPADASVRRVLAPVPRVEVRVIEGRKPKVTPVDAALRREQLLLRKVRSALNSGEAQDAVSALAEYRAQYAGGRLNEEASALEIRARSALGQKQLAQTLAQEFLRQYPKSLYREVAEKVIGE